MPLSVRPSLVNCSDEKPPPKPPRPRVGASSSTGRAAWVARVTVSVSSVRVQIDCTGRPPSVLVVAKASNRPSGETAVAMTASGLRVKLKGSAYLTLHKLIWGLSEGRILEALTAGTYADLLREVPEEFRPEVAKMAAAFQQRAEAFEAEARRLFALAPQGSDRESVRLSAPRSLKLTPPSPTERRWTRAHSTLFEDRVRLFVYFARFRFRYPAGVGRLACTSFGVAGVSLVLDRVSALSLLGEVACGKSPTARGIRAGSAGR